MATLASERKKQSQSSAHSEAPMSLRDELKRVTRDRLIKAAENLFQTQGFRTTSVDQIVKAAGTTATTFYRHFKSKSDLASLVQDKLALEVKKVLIQLDAMRKPSRLSIRKWINDYYEMWRRNHILCDAYWEATTIDPELAKNIMPVTMKLTDSLQGYLSNFPEDKKRKAQLRLSFFTLFLDRFIFIAHNLPSPKERSELFDEISDVLWISLYQPNRWS